MPYYAQVIMHTPVLGEVVNVIAANQEFIDSGAVGSGWILTSYGTRGGIHYDRNNKPDGGEPLRKNFAGIGFVYNAELDAFYAPSPYPSWKLNLDTCWWEPPVPIPEDSDKVYYQWDEATLSWVPLTQE